MKSSSIHTCNNDNGLNKAGKIKWFLMNVINNLLGNINVDEDLWLKNIKFPLIDSTFEKTGETLSPARTLSDMFWYSIPYEEMVEILGGKVNALEVGCGRGDYGILLETYLGDALIKYKGVDSKPYANWDEISNGKFEFEISDSTEVEEYVDSHNLIITQSAIEHFNQDVVFFEKLQKYIRKHNKPVIQIHLMPSSSCLYTFLWHGVRQYSPRTISRITRLYDSDDIKTLYCLGSSKSNRVHRKYITYPKLKRKDDRRYTETAKYRNDLLEAIKVDQLDPRNDKASFYALIITSNANKNLDV